MFSLSSLAWVLAAILVHLTCFECLAVEKKSSREQETEESRQEEPEEIKDDDFPDLVAADEEGGLMDEFALLEDAGMVESAARHRQEIGMSPSAITVITREDIEASGATAIADLFRLVPGMDVISPSPTFTGVTARLYWTEENLDFLVLVDGREANVELLGFTNFDLQHIFPEDIERIEIIRGPGSSLYGANAMAGVISITTRAIYEEPSAWARVSAGEPGAISVAGRASSRVGDWGFMLGGGMDNAQMFTDLHTTGKRVWKIRSAIERRFPGSGRLLLDGGFSKSSGSVCTAIGTMEGGLSLATIRLAYQSDALSGRLYWTFGSFDTRFRAPLDYGGIRLAQFTPAVVDGHTVDGEIMWTLPRFVEPLLIIAGGGGRISRAGSDHVLDAETYADRGSPDYHQPGISHWEGRVGAFVHGELALFDWVTVTGGIRFDYNTVTEMFLSPRLAAVFRPAEGHFVRLGVARAFRKPAFVETHLHPMVEFPEGSPIKGAGEEGFQEFMARVLGNANLDNEKLLSLEAGYLVQLLNNRVSVALDFYYNMISDVVMVITNIVEDQNGLPDLDLSSVQFENDTSSRDTFGSELSIRYNPSRSVSLLASWAHREVLGRESNNSPKNLLTLGGRFLTESGFTGSLYAHTRSEFVDRAVGNPAGLLEPFVQKRMDNVMLFLGKLGWRFNCGSNVELEAGMKLFLPVSPFADPHFRFHEKGGGVTLTGQRYGGAELGRMVTGYLLGTY